MTSDGSSAPDESRAAKKARAHVGDWMRRKTQLRDELRKEGLGPRDADELASTLTELLESTERIARHVRAMGSPKRSSTHAAVELIIQFALLESRMPRNHAVMSRVRKLLIPEVPSPNFMIRATKHVGARKARASSGSDRRL